MVFVKGNIPYNKGMKRPGIGGVKKGNVPWNKGKRYPQVRGDKNGFWKGDDVGYHGIHKWVYSRLGKSDVCEFCGTSGLSEHKIQWANKDHKYRRNIKDWIRLCAKCHVAYDRGRKDKSIDLK